MTLASWNVRTMLDNDDRPERRTALIAKELHRCGVSIAALQETRIEGQGQLSEEHYTFFWVGKDEGRRDAGVAFAVDNKIASKLTSFPSAISERMMTLRVPIGHSRHLTLINVYAPTMTYTSDEKEAFYQELALTVEKVPSEDKLAILGDFNARVGSDHETYDDILGKFGKGKKNSNGDLLLNFCTQHKLCITNTFFHQPDKNYYSWMHPRSKHWHLLDYVITRKESLSDVLCTKARRGPECSTDHQLIYCKCRLNITLPRRKTKPNGKPKKLNTKALTKEEHEEKLCEAITAALKNTTYISNISEDIEERWKNLKDTVFEAAEETLGYPQRNTADWFLESDKEIQVLLDEKRRLYESHLQHNTEQSKAAFNNVRAKVQREIRKLKDSWWQKKAEELQKMADNQDYQGLFAGLRAVYGPKSNTVTPVKSADGSKLHTDLSEIQKRWKEHFQTLLNQQGSAQPDACRFLQSQQCQDDLSKEITLEELLKALKSTASGKSAGLDGIPSEVLNKGGQQLHLELLELFNCCLSSGTIPQDFKDALIVTIYKMKGDRADCGNHRGISLLATAGKVLAKIILNRLKVISEKVLPESQCGFRTGRSTNDMIFTLRQIQEKAIEQHQPLYVVFVDFSKAFDTVDRDTLWKVLEIYGCPKKIINLIKQFHTGMKGQVLIGGEPSEPFDINHGVKQGCVLAPTLFSLFLTAVLDTMKTDLNDGVYIRTRSTGKLFNLARLRATTKTRELVVRELLYADDSALLATDPTEIQHIVDKFAEASDIFGLRINISKTELLHPYTADNPPVVTVHGQPLKVCETFTYLGSTVTPSNSSDIEVERRKQSATKAFGSLTKRLWKCHDVRRDTKVKVYNAAVLPCLLYATECITLYSRHIKDLTSLQVRHLRSILHIRWQEKVPDVEVLRRAECVSVEALITSSQLRWSGHVCRMEDERLPKAVFYGELKDGKRSVGGQKLRYKDVLKRHLKNTNTPIDTWEKDAQDRPKWRKTVKSALYKTESMRRTKYEKAHERRHTAITSSNYKCGKCDKFCRSNAGLAAHLRHCTR